MKNKAHQPQLTEPDITTYENTELTVDVAFTDGSSKSSRRIKADFRRVDAGRTLCRLLSRRDNRR